MLRKHLLTDHLTERVAEPGDKDIAALATVWVTSEAADYPIDNVLDSRRGPGGSRWIAGEPGPQRLLLAFDAPQTLRLLRLEVEERDVSRTQEIQVAISRDEGQIFLDGLRNQQPIKRVAMMPRQNRTTGDMTKSDIQRGKAVR